MATMSKHLWWISAKTAERIEGRRMFTAELGLIMSICRKTKCAETSKSAHALNSEIIIFKQDANSALNRRPAYRYKTFSALRPWGFTRLRPEAGVTSAHGSCK